MYIALMEWKEIPGHERYKVSSNGQIMGVRGIIRKPWLAMNGKKNDRYKIDLWDKSIGCKTMHFVHRLVAKAFLPNPLDLPEVNHIDGNTLNNNVSNLEWCTHLHNVDHAYKNNLMTTNKGKILTRDEIIAIREYPIPTTNSNGGKLREKLCKEYGVSLHVVKDIRSGRSWSHVV